MNRVSFLPSDFVSNNPIGVEFNPELQATIVEGSKFDIMRGSGADVFMWRHGVKFEESAMKQLISLSKMPFVHHHIAAMPDCHWGMGATVGSVFASLGAVIPAAVGVDIGCGMIALPVHGIRRDDLTPQVLGEIRANIERNIPMGRTNNGGPGDRGAWGEIPGDVQRVWDEELADRFGEIVAKHPAIAKGNLVNHLGTLGTGNHFIEVQVDEADDVWIMLHSGSRGVGNRIGTYFIKKAQELCAKYLIRLPDKDLAYLPDGDPLYADYIQALEWAQNFAYENRQIMLLKSLSALRDVLPQATLTEPAINTHHNYASIEKHFGKTVLLTRKGAIRAGKGELGIIPGSMGTRSYIVRGLGNPLSFLSCSHGAGRAMSRTEAKKRFTLEDHAKATEGVECLKTAEVLDETPGAYKNIDDVIEAEKDLVEVVHVLKQLLCCKGA